MYPTPRAQLITIARPSPPNWTPQTMTRTEPDDHWPDVDVGDRIIAAVDLGGLFRGRIRRRTQGIIIGRTPDGRVIVTFGTRLTYTVRTFELTPVPPPTARDHR